MISVWISDNRNIMNRTIAFQKQIVVNEMQMKIAAASLYRIMVDGKMFGYGPARAAHGYSRVDVYDLSEFNGKNIVITIEVFASCINSYYVVDELPFFAIEISKNNCIIYNSKDFTAYDETDRVRQVQRFSFQRTFVESYKMKESRKQFYEGKGHMFPKLDIAEVSMNKLLERNVSYPTYEKVIANCVSPLGKVSIVKPNEIYHDRYIQNIGETLKGYKFDELEEFLSDEICGLDFEKTKILPNDNYFKTYDFTRTVSGFICVNVNVKKASTIYIIWDEVISNDGRIDPFRNTCCNGIKYQLLPGEYDLLSFESNTARFMQIVVLGEANTSEVGMVLYENPDINKCAIDIKDEQLLKIYEAARNTFAQNAVDILTDCPSRERAGWLCDSYFSARAERLFTGESKVERNFLENYILAQQLPHLPEGMLPMCYPSDHNDGVFIPNWAMWFVLELKNYFEVTNDKELVDKAKSKVYMLINYFSKYLNEYGLLESLDGWVFVEWSKCNDSEYICGVNFPSNMLYASMLEAAGNLYDDIELVSKCKIIKNKILELSFNGEFFEENCIRQNGKLIKIGHLTETCQYYAFYFHVAQKEKYTKLYKILMNDFGPTREYAKEYKEVFPSNAIIGNYLRLELLLRDRNYEQVLKECKEFFLKMADKTGTLWEHSNENASLNHGFASVAAEYIVRSL